MKSYGIVGYAMEGYAICIRCASDEQRQEADPIFAESEWDSYPTCDVCNEAITDVNLTEQGQQEEDRREARKAAQEHHMSEGYYAWDDGTINHIAAYDGAVTYICECATPEIAVIICDTLNKHTSTKDMPNYPA